MVKHLIIAKNALRQAKRVLTLVSMWMDSMARPRRPAMERTLILRMAWASGRRGDGVGYDQLLESGGGNALDGGAAEDGVGSAGVDPGGTLVQDGFDGFDEGSSRVDDIVEDDTGSSAYFADDVHDFGNVDVGAAFIDDREGSVEFFGEEAGAFDSTCIRGDDGEVREVHVAEVADKDRTGEEVIDGDVEEALDLSGVKVDEKGTVGPGGGEQVGDELGGDGDAGAVFAVLARA